MLIRLGLASSCECCDQLRRSTSVEVTQPSPAAVQQHQQDHHAAMLASRQVSELLHQAGMKVTRARVGKLNRNEPFLCPQERARAAAARLRNLVAPPFKDLGQNRFGKLVFSWQRQQQHVIVRG